MGENELYTHPQNLFLLFVNGAQNIIFFGGVFGKNRDKKTTDVISKLVFIFLLAIFFIFVMSGKILGHEILHYCTMVLFFGVTFWLFKNHDKKQNREYEKSPIRLRSFSRLLQKNSKFSLARCLFHAFLERYLQHTK